MASTASQSAGHSSNSTTPSSSGSASSWQYQNSATEEYLTNLNHTLGRNYMWALFAVILIVTAVNAFIRVNAHIRHLASLNNVGAQKYFALAHSAVAWIKDQVLYAPIFYHRRATELRFSRRITLGTLPSRFQALFIGCIIIFNIFGCTWNVPWSDPQLQVLPILRNRSGTLSVVNLLPLLVLATVKNPLINLLDISYDTFNLIHRWLGRISVLQAITHTLCWLIAKIQQSGWQAVERSIPHQFIYSGLAATIGFTVLLMHSPKMVRSLAYEFFLSTHIIVVIISLAFLWIHLQNFPQQKYLLGAILVWAVARVWRFATLVYRSAGKEMCNAAIEAMPGDALRISLTSPRPWAFRPGQYLYLTLPSVGLLTAHPFSVAWNGIEDPLARSASIRSNYDEKAPVLPKDTPEVERTGQPTISLIVKAKSGMTKNLYDRALRAGAQEGARLSLNALIEGPYGHEKSLASYGNLMLFASGVGITHQIPYVRELVEGYAAGTVAARKITLVWAIPSTECLEWIRPWMHEVLKMERRREILTVLLHITKAGLSQDIRSPSETVKMFRGRPHVETLMKREAKEKLGCMGISVCAGGGLADEVRRVSRILSAKGVNLDFIEEGFGW